MVHCFDVGSYIYHPVHGYGEITTVSENEKEVFIDFQKGHYGWFPIKFIENSPKIFNVEKAFMKVIFDYGDNKGLGIKDILKKYKDYRIIEILF